MYTAYVIVFSLHLVIYLFNSISLSKYKLHKHYYLKLCKLNYNKDDKMEG